jgi:hypothetical protein
MYEYCEVGDIEEVFVHVLQRSTLSSFEDRRSLLTKSLESFNPILCHQNTLIGQVLGLFASTPTIHSL